MNLVLLFISAFFPFSFCTVQTLRPPFHLSPSERLSRILARGAPSYETNPGNGSFQFAPLYKATLFPGTAITWNATCFSYDAVLELGEDYGSVTYQASPLVNVPKDSTCEDLFLWADLESFYVSDCSTTGKHAVQLVALTSTELADLSFNGLQVFQVAHGLARTIVDIIDTASLFFGPWTMQEAVEFVQDHMNITYAPRSNVFINVSQDSVPSGTYLATQRFDGSEVMIQYGTGSYSGHSTIAVRLNGTLHVCESTGQNQPDYWPPPYGVICHLWDEWMQLAHTAGYSVSLMPLREDLQSKWSDEAAQVFIESRLGMPYGFHNFLFGWLDTVDSNYPPPFSPQFLEVAFSLIGRLMPDVAQSFFVDALNMRLGQNCSSFECIVEYLLEQQMKLIDALILPEQDDWIYPDGYSTVCNVFVLEVYKAAGIFDVEFQATEFTPKDLYTLAIFQEGTKENYPDCPELPEQVCQIMGLYVAQFPDWNTIEPYDNMCNHCDSQWPEYERYPPQC